MRVVGRDEMPDTTLLIQGPLMEDTYKFYCRFYPEIPKVFSTWEGNCKDWREPSDKHSSGDFFLEVKKPERFGIYEVGLDRRVVGTLVGLEKVKTNYCVVLRGDEWYSNLDGLEKTMEADSDRIHTTSVFFRKWDVCPFHPGDHLLAGNTDNLRLMFGRTMINMVTRKRLDPSGRPLPAAAVLGRSYMEAKVGESSDWRGDFAKSFGIVPLEWLKYYKVVSDESGRVWYSNFGEKGKDFDPAKDGTWERSISDMKDL